MTAVTLIFDLQQRKQSQAWSSPGLHVYEVWSFLVQRNSSYLPEIRSDDGETDGQRVGVMHPVFWQTYHSKLTQEYINSIQKVVFILGLLHVSHLPPLCVATAASHIASHNQTTYSGQRASLCRQSLRQSYEKRIYRHQHLNHVFHVSLDDTCCHLLSWQHHLSTPSPVRPSACVYTHAAGHCISLNMTGKLQESK